MIKAEEVMLNSFYLSKQNSAFASSIKWG